MSAAARPRLVVISAGLREPSSTRLLGERLAETTSAALRRHGMDAEVGTVELRHHARDLANAAVTGFAAGALRDALTAVAGSDAVIAVTPIFSASYSGLFKLFVDALDPEALRGTPVLLAATGGTARHSLAVEHAMRPLFSYLGALTVPTAVFAAAEDWGPGAAELGSRMDRAADELASLVASRPANTPTDDYADVPSFSELLRRGTT